MADSSIPYVYAPIRVDGNEHWDSAVMYNSPLRPAIDADADEILMVLLSPYYKVEENAPRPIVQRSALPPAPRGLLGSIGYVLDLALIGTFENDFEELRKVNRRVRQCVTAHFKLGANLLQAPVLGGIAQPARRPCEAPFRAEDGDGERNDSLPQK